MSTVLLTGATGLVGRLCLELLLKDPFFSEVKVIARHSLYHDDPKLKEFVTNFDELEKYRDEFATHINICCLGSTMKEAGSREQFMKVDHDYPLQIAKLARQEGCQNFLVVSAVGADKDSLFFYSRVKGLMEADVKVLPFDSISFLQPSLIDGERKEFRVMEQLSLKAARMSAFLLKGSLKKYQPTPARDIARALCELAKHPAPGIHTYSSIDIQNLSSRYIADVPRGT